MGNGVDRGVGSCERSAVAVGVSRGVAATTGELMEFPAGFGVVATSGELRELLAGTCAALQPTSRRRKNVNRILHQYGGNAGVAPSDQWHDQLGLNEALSITSSPSSNLCVVEHPSPHGWLIGKGTGASSHASTV